MFGVLEKLPCPVTGGFPSQHHVFHECLCPAGLADCILLHFCSPLWAEDICPVVVQVGLCVGTCQKCDEHFTWHNTTPHSCIHTQCVLLHLLRLGRRCPSFLSLGSSRQRYCGGTCGCVWTSLILRGFLLPKRQLKLLNFYGTPCTRGLKFPLYHHSLHSPSP